MKKRFKLFWQKFRYVDVPALSYQVEELKERLRNKEFVIVQQKGMIRDLERGIEGWRKLFTQSTDRREENIIEIVKQFDKAPDVDHGEI